LCDSKSFQKARIRGLLFYPSLWYNLKNPEPTVIKKIKESFGRVSSRTAQDWIIHQAFGIDPLQSPSLANPSVDCLLQLVTSSSPIVFSSFFLENIAFFSLFFWLLQVLLGFLHFFVAIGVLCFFIVLLLVSSILLALCVDDSTNLINTLLVAVS